MYPNLDALIARTALRLWISDRKVERITKMHTFETREIVNVPPCRADLPAPAYAPLSPFYEEI